MATKQDVLAWYDRDLGRYAPRRKTMLPWRNGFRIYTDNNRYSIGITDPDEECPNGYLGCISTSRKARAGEVWERGHDLPDGPLTEETWRDILAAIVSSELVNVHFPAKVRIADMPDSMPPAS